MNHDQSPSRSGIQSDDGSDASDDCGLPMPRGEVGNSEQVFDSVQSSGSDSAARVEQVASEVPQEKGKPQVATDKPEIQSIVGLERSVDVSSDAPVPGDSRLDPSKSAFTDSSNPPTLPISGDDSVLGSLSVEKIHPEHAIGPKPLIQPSGTQQDPLRQSLFLLATMAVLLLAARYFVPRIVEEIRYSWHRGELRAEYESGSEGLRNVSLDTLSKAYQMVTSTVGPSVVHIDVKQPSAIGDIRIQGQFIPGFHSQTDQGSGVIVTSNGYVLTNRHVIDGGEEIYVTLGDGRRLSAAIIGTDKQTDLAVLKVDADDLIPISWGDSDRCRVGSPVWAVGSPFGLDQTVTFGILSGKHRMVEDSTHYQDFMQSDVAVNPGNSGGPLVDARGALVGINTAIVGESYQGVSFAVPSNVAKQVYERLKEIGRVDRGWLGVRLSEVDDQDLIGDNPHMRGAVVSGLTNDDSPAALAGLKLGDHILMVDSEPVRDLPHLMRLIGGSLAGSDITLELVRQGKPLTVTVVLGARPELLNQP